MIPTDDDDDDDDDDEIGDITDVWDEEKLKAALGELHKTTETGPATKSQRQVEESIQIDRGPVRPNQEAGPGAKIDTDPPPRRAGALSWPLTIGLAVVLAVAVYLLVTFLK